MYSIFQTESSHLAEFNVFRSSNIGSDILEGGIGCGGTSDTVPIGGSQTLPCTEPARYIGIAKTRGCTDCDNSKLVLCEVEVTATGDFNFLNLKKVILALSKVLY